MEFFQNFRSHAVVLPNLAKFALGMVIIVGVPSLCRRIRLPAVVGLVLTGTIIGPNVMGFFGENRPVPEFLADLGKLLLMFVAGLEIDLAQFRNAEGRSITFGLLTTTIPLLLGTTVRMLFGYSVTSAIVIGSLLASHTLLAAPIVTKLGANHLEPVTVTFGATVMSDKLSLVVFAICVSTYVSGFSAFRLILQILQIAILVPVILLGLGRVGAALARRVASSAPPRYDSVPLLLHDMLVIACIDAGELIEARAYLAEADTARKPWELPWILLFLEGDWEPAGKMLTAEFERSRTAGDRYQEWWATYHLARSHRLTGEPGQAMQFLLRALQISVDGRDIALELATRPSLATMAADAGIAGEALQHLQRCRQIVAAGENWLGLAGSVERAEAVVTAARGEYSAAKAYFEKAIASFQRYSLPWEEADTLQYWGRALLAAGQPSRAIEKFDAAIEIYRSRGASVRFVEYVMTDKMRAQGSKSTDTEVQSPPTDSVHANAPAPAHQLQAPTSNDRIRDEVSPPRTRAVDAISGSHIPAGVGGESRRVVATILFIDIVGSTEHVTKLKDRGWVELRRSFFEEIREQLASFNGREIDATGDGMLAIFENPAAAIQCAFAMSQGVEKLGLQMRAGIHTGECELVGGDAIGIAVHIGARVASQAGPNEVMVSSTVRDLLVGGEITFVDRGVGELKGIPGEWRLYAVERQS